MYISKKIEASWTRGEIEKIEEFRRFLQNTAAEVKDLMPSLYKELDKVDSALYEILYSCYEEEVNLRAEDEEK